MTMEKQQPRTNYYFLKCALNSFVSTYITGILHPLDVIKTRFQSHDGQAQNQNLVPKYRGIINGLFSVYNKQGFKGLYRGFHISIFSQASATGLFFWIYELEKDKYQKKGFSDINSILLASTKASFLGTLFTQPMWVVKTRMLLNTTNNITQSQNFISICKQIYRQDGYKGYSKGLSLSLLLSFNGIIQMTTYEGLQYLYQYLKIPGSSFLQKNFFCGFVSKFFVIIITYPVTTIRTRIQQNQYVIDDKTKKYKGVKQIILKTWRDERLFGFYKGLNANLIKGVLSKGMYFYLYQLIKLSYQNTNSFQSH